VDAITFLIQCLNAVQYGLLLFLVASGLTLIFGAMGIINLAHGSFYMLGAYFAYALAPWVGAHLHGGFFTTLVVGVLLSIALGYALEWAFFRFLYEREHLQQVLLTYALILIFEELRSVLVDDDVHGVAISRLVGRRSIPRERHDLSGLSPVHLGGLSARRARPPSGAVAHAARNGDPRRLQQPRDGPVPRIDVRLLHRLVFAGGVALAVFAG